ncbi:uncharacterized protein [Temnothorax nylanderi]|uniref:uncharacterized protein n=1 Tax=Temnothorax nylanderi TaxID=102681 RepID=UPI003A857260
MSVASDSSGTPSRMSVANDSSGTPSKILIDKDLQSTAQEKEVADEVPSQFKSPAEIRGYPKAIHQYGTRKRRQQGSSKILTDSPEKKSLVEKKKKQEEKENKTRKRKPKKTVMIPKKKRSKFWNYFEELKPLLVKCTTCKKEIKVSDSTYYTKLMRLHLSRHGIFLENDTHTLPDDLKQYYSELPGYKAKCNNCAKAVSFLSNIAHLRKHLRRHSTRIQSRDKTVMVPRKKRSKLWNYFEELKPTLVKCTTCKKEIKMSHPANRITIMRVHLFKKHGISLDGDTLTLPDDLKQYYSELPGYKAKCNNCGKAVSFLTNIARLQKHLRTHSTRILSRDETVMVPRKKRSKLWNYFEELKPTLVKCTTYTIVLLTETDRARQACSYSG